MTGRASSSGSQLVAPHQIRLEVIPADMATSALNTGTSKGAYQSRRYRHSVSLEL